MNHRITYSSEGISLHPDALKAIALFASEDTTRKHLCSVFLDDEGHLTATNGQAMARLCSIDPGGFDPKQRDGTRWSLDVVEKVTYGIPRARAARSRASVWLLWDTAERDAQRPPQCGRFFDTHIKSTHTGEPACIATRYMRKIVEATELLLGKDTQHRAPVLLNSPGDTDLHHYGIPWRDDEPADEGTWALGSKRSDKPAPRAAAPEYGAEIVVAPLRIK